MVKEQMWQGYRKRKRRYGLVCLCLFLVLLFLAAGMMMIGHTFYSLDTVLRVLWGEAVSGASFTIRVLRLPRMLAGILVGMGFGMAGNTFQKLLGNPLASPDIIGITSGASVAAVFAILVLGLSGGIVSILAVLSGSLTAALIYVFSKGEGFSNGRLILCGIGAQAFLNALISWMLLKASEYDVANALRWLSGSLNGVSLDDIPLLACVVGISACILVILNRQLQILALGESFAVSLGVNVQILRLALILVALFLVAFSTSVTGPIASVAFLSGPIASRMAGYGRSNLLPSALVGAILVCAADLVGQNLFFVRYPVGVITGILGAPYLIFLLMRMNRKGVSV